MLRNYMGILNLNENEHNIISLTKHRPLASIPIGGRYRIIDFILSNMVNSGLKNIGIFTQSKSRSLVDHLGSGKPWDLDRRLNGLFVFNFGIANETLSDIDMIKNNMEYIYRSKEENVILSSSYMICNMDYKTAVQCHEQSGKDITIIYKRIDNGKSAFVGCDVLNINEEDQVISVGKNTGIDNYLNISMEMFIMKKSTLIELVNQCVKNGYFTTIKDAVYQSITEYSLNAYEFKGYLTCINSIHSYYKSNMDMLNPRITKELFFKNGLIYTKVKDEPPTKYGRNCKVSNSFIANGCIIKGHIENSIIARGVTIHEGAVVRNCIILQKCEINEDCHLSNVIMDKNVVLKPHKELKGDIEFPLVIEKKALY